MKRCRLVGSGSTLLSQAPAGARGYVAVMVFMWGCVALFSSSDVLLRGRVVIEATPAQEREPTA